MNTDTQTYIPGVCNINHAEIKRRRKTGYVGLALFIVLGVILFATSVNQWFRLVLFVPAFIGTIGFLQAKNKFCVGYAASGLQNATDGNTSTQKVEAAAHRIDKARAQKMNLQAAGIALLVTIIVTLI